MPKYDSKLNAPIQLTSRKILKVMYNPPPLEEVYHIGDPKPDAPKERLPWNVESLAEKLNTARMLHSHWYARLWKCCKGLASSSLCSVVTILPEEENGKRSDWKPSQSSVVHPANFHALPMGCAIVRRVQYLTDSILRSAYPLPNVTTLRRKVEGH
jgi:hypothetical protein